MTCLSSTWFRNICRLVLFLFTLAAFHPASLRVPWHLDISFDTETLTLNFELGTLNFGPPPAYGQLTDPNLAATPDADKDDSYIIEKAQELGNDPSLIFAFVRDEISYESYRGSLRGARGTLWSKAGNALDQASLLIALLRASGIPARYAQGTLATSDAQELILSMFPAPLRVVGCLDPGIEEADPANDPKLLDETREHYWVQFNAGNGFRDADPTFVGAAIGQTFTSLGGSFNEVPDNLRHTVTVRLKRELTLPLTGLFGVPSQDIATVLNETFPTVTAVGKPLSIGHLVSRSGIGSPLFTSITNVYSPYISVGDFDAPLDQLELVRGQDYQEVITNFPFGSQILTGLFLEVDLNGPDGFMESFTRTLADRIGFAIRQNGGNPNLTFDPNGPAFLSALDIFSLHVLPGLNSPSFPGRLPELAVQIEQGLAAVPTELPPSPEATTQLTSLLQNSFALLTRGYGSGFLTFSDALTEQIAARALVKVYFDRPRLVLVSSRIEPDPGAQQLKSSFAIDLRRDRIRSVAFPGQRRAASQAFNATRGIAESIAEGEALSLLRSSDQQQSQRVSAALIFEEALTQGIGLTTLTKESLTGLEALNLSAEAKARISQALAQGKAVIAPTQAVSVNGVVTTGWYEVDAETGETIGVLEDGGHGFFEREGVFAAIVYTAVTLVGVIILDCLFILANGSNCFAQIPSQLTSFGTGVQNFGSGIQNPNNPFVTALGKVIFGVGQLLAGLGHLVGGSSTLVSSLAQAEATPSAVNAIALANSSPADNTFAFLLKGILQVPPLDVANGPPLNAFLFSPGTPGPFGSLNGAGVAADIVAESQFALPFNGGQLPTAFRIGVKNTGAVKSTFDLNFTNIPTGFTAQTSVSQITIPPGETAEVGICLRPTSSLPAPGTPASFTLNVSNTTNGAISTAETKPFIVPEIHGVTLESAPPVVNTTPGAPVEATLVLQSVGNVPEIVSFITSLPTGLSTNNLGSVSLAVGEVATRTLTLTPSANTPLNSTLTASVTANFNALEGQTIVVPVRVAVPGADAIANASVAAGQLGNPDLANRLNDLSIALTNLVQNPGNAVFKSQALANLNSLISLLANDSTLSGFVGELTAARNALESATAPNEIQTAVNELGAALGSFATTATDLALHNVEVFLLPNTQTAQPQTPVVFEVRLHNIGLNETTYNLSLDGLPASVTGQLSQSSVTLVRDEFASVTLTLTQTSTTELSAFDFSVLVAAEEAPAITRSTHGALTVRKELISVASVTADPPFVDPGVSTTISTRLLNAVNMAQQALTSYLVKDPNGQTVFTSQPVPTTLTVQTELLTLSLGSLDTTGFALGDYTILVSLTKPNGDPIPGATGEGNLLIGSPVTASLSIAPETLPPGNGTVTTTLRIDSHIPLLPPLALVGQEAVPAANGVAVKDNLAYVCGSNGINIVDFTNPATPTLVKTFGSASRGCRIVGDLLLALQGASPFTLQIYFLTNDPLTPALLGSTAVNYGFAFDFYANSTHAYVSLLQVCWLLSNHDIYFQGGDLLSLALNPNTPVNPTSANPALLDVLMNTHGDRSFDPTDISGCPESGGDHNVWQIAQVDAQTLLLASTTATDSNTTGVGHIFVVDISNPAALNIVREVQIPGTTHAIGVAVEGTTGLVVSSTGGWRDFFPFPPNDDFLLLGNLVFTTLDLSDPRNPQIVASRSIPRQSRTFWTSTAALGNGLFAFSNLGGANEPTQVMLINAADPANPAVSQLDTPAQAIGPNAMTAKDDLLFVSGDSAGLLIYEIGDFPTVQTTAQVQVPKNTGVMVVPGSFNLPPTQTILGPDFDTLVWEIAFSSGNASQTLTWQTNVTDLQPGEARPVTLGAMIDFSSLGVNGQFTLPSLEVASQQILSITPETQTIAPGESIDYTLVVSNPTASAVTYDLTVQGVPQAWVDLELASVDVPALDQVFVNLTSTPDLFAQLGEYGFVVTASTSTGMHGSAPASLVLEGEPVIPEADAQARGVEVALTPIQATAGQGTEAHFTVRVTNTGSETDTFTLGVIVPPGLTGTFVQNVFDIAPGASNFRDVPLTITVASGTTPGSYTITPFAFSLTREKPDDFVDGTVVVVSEGVEVEVTPSSGAPIGGFQLTVKNTGANEDTFDLTLGGPVGVVSTLGTNAVTLISGASQTVPITVGAISFAVLNSLELIGTATSRGNIAVHDSDRAVVTIGQVKGLTAAFNPSLVELPTPGDTRFLLVVNNVGNQEDAYTAEIMGMNGPVTAALIGVNRQLTQKVDLFRLPGLSQGGIVLNATLSGVGEGKVTVKVTSLTDASLTAEAVATVRTPGLPQNQAPVVEAGPNQTVTIGQAITLAATFTDVETTDTHSATVNWGDGVQNGAMVSESGGNGLVSGSHSYSQAGSYTVEVCVADHHQAQGCDTFTVKVSQQVACGVCTEPPVIVDSVIEFDAAHLTQTAGVLAPFASFDGQTIMINVGDRPLVVTSNGRISVPAGPRFHPTAFHQGDNHSSPHLVLQSSCALELDAPLSPVAKLQTRSLTGVIETVGNGGRGGDITLAFAAGIFINGRVQSVQERLPDDPRSISGAITMESECGPLEIGPTAWVVSWGDKGSGAVTLRQGGDGDLTIAGLVMNRVNRNGSPEGPTIKVQTEGNLTIDGSHLIADEFNLEGTRVDLTSGLLTLAREPASVGQIRVQAQGDITITRDVRGLAFNRPSYAAVAAVGTSGTPQGGDILVHSLHGAILLRDRAVQADGKRDNSVALIEVVADHDVVVASPSALDARHGPTLTTGASPVNGVGKGGINVLQSCDGSVAVEAQAQVLATGQSVPGRNELTADDGTVLVQGTVTPAPVAGTVCNDPDPLF
ncbi:MAG: PKD domain-containing protein [Candidatus Binatia bacterium]